MFLTELSLKYLPADNPRLKWMLAVIPLLLAIYVIFTVHDYRIAWQAEITADRLRLQKLSSAAGQSGWEAYAERAEAAKRTAEESLLKVASENIAKAIVQSQIESMLASHDIESTGVRAEAVRLGDSQFKLVQVMVSLQGSFNSQHLYAFLRELEVSTPALVVEQLEMTSGRRSQFRMTLTGLVMLEE